MTEDFKRKLTAILSADVVGYSRLMGEDEELTVRTLSGHREMMSTLIRQHQGRVVDSPGDNLLAEFESITRAVDCAVEIQREMAERNEELPDDRKMEYRIGVNLGDVIEEGERIYGDGVNIAARLESLAEPGGICISGFVYNQVKNRLKLEYEFMGERSVKNIKEPVPVYRVLSFPGAAAHRVIKAKEIAQKSWRNMVIVAVVALVVFLGILAIWKYYPRGPSIEPSSIEPEQTPVVVDVEETKKTIAVLPFVNLSSDPEQEYFVDGLSEELLNNLTQISDLRVTSRTSSFSFKGTNKKAQEIANELGVEHILEGSVRKAGNALRITAQLIRALDDFHLWSMTYDRELKDIFEVQEDIATNVADELKVTLGVGKSLKQVGGTDDLKAYELYLVAKGQHNAYENNQALESIDAAITLDPGFALAWALKGMVHFGLAVVSPADRASLEKDAGLKAALRAIEIEPSLGKACLSLGSVHLMRGEFIEAELAYRKGMELTTEPIDYFEYWLTQHYEVVGYFRKCRDLLEEIQRYNPLQPILRSAYILNLGLLGDMERAEEEYERYKAIFGDQLYPGHINITVLRLGAKDVFSINEIPELPPALFPIWAIAREHVESPEEGLAKLRRLFNSESNLHSANLIYMACWAAYFGDPEFALNATERSVNLQTSFMHFIWAPVMKEVRQLPRFKEWVRETGLMNYWKEFGWPDLCHPVGDDDFVCD